MINKGLASLSSVIELLNEILNRSMVQPIDINVDKGMEKSYRIHDMVIDSICFLPSEEKPFAWHSVKGKI